MPLYDYRCEPCDRRFEALVRDLNQAVPCPHCGHEKAERLMSAPAAAQVGRGSLPVAAAAPAQGCGRPQCAGGTCAGF